ncbi:MAG: chemotaxis protein CheW, partial [Anaerolineae bacterium]|nr:chemotaxis protein CheW [Anaerolineae bacterium]
MCIRDSARRLAQPPEAPVSGETVDLVVLTLGVETYGVEARFVQEVFALDETTPVPGVPEFWAGLINLRGHLYPLLDLRRFLGLPALPADAGGEHRGDSCKVALVAASGLEVGLLVDDVPQVRQVLCREIGVSPIEATGAGHPFTAGVTADLVTVLDVEALLSDPRLVVQMP